jgi:hypothetical protein
MRTIVNRLKRLWTTPVEFYGVDRPEPQAGRWQGLIIFVVLMVGVSANLLYGFERFILQSVRSGHVKLTFEREGRLESESTLESRGTRRGARIRRNP